MHSFGKIGMALFRKLKQQSHEFMTPSNSNIFLIPKTKSTFSGISDTKVYSLNICPCMSTIIGIMNNTLMNCPFPTWILCVFKCHFFSKEIQYLGHILSTKGIWLLPLKTLVIQKMHLPTTPKQVCAFLGLVGYYRKFIKDFAKIAKPLTLLIWQQVKFEWTPAHHEAFLKLKESIIQGPILCYPNPNKRYIVYTDAWDDACRVQLSQEHDGTEFPIAFLSHLFFGNAKKMEYNWKRSVWSLVCHYKMELLSPRSGYCSQEWSQTTHQIFKWKMPTIRSTDGDLS